MNPDSEIPQKDLLREEKSSTASSRWSSRLKLRIFDHSINAFLIFVSVFLAFWLNDYRLKQIQQIDTDRAFEAVITEVENNLGILQRWAPYHLQMLQRLEELFEKDSVRHLSNFDPSILVEDYRGIMREILTRHAQELVKLQNIHIDLERRMDIIMIYEQQKFVENALDRLIEMTYERAVMDSARIEETYRVFFAMLGDLYGQEEAMIRNYRYRLDRLQKDK